MTRADAASRRLGCGARRWWALVALAGAALLAITYLPAMDAPFYLDDAQNLKNNRAIQMDEFGWEPLRRAVVEGKLPQRAVANLSFALNHYLIGGSPPDYRAVNIAIHLANGLLVFLLIRRTLRLARPAAGTRGVDALSALCALVWLVHPLHIQSVTYLVQRMTSLAVLFYLIAMLCYIRGRLVQDGPRAWVYFSSSLLAGLLAFGCKEIAITLPVFLLIYELLFLKATPSGGRPALWLGGAVVAAIVTGLAVIGGSLTEELERAYALREFTLEQRLLTQPRVVLFYLGLLLYPHPSRLSLDHDFPISLGLLAPVTTSIAIGVLALMALTAVFLARRQPVLAFALLWFLGQLVLESSVFALEMVFEHRSYLPSVGVVLALAYLLQRPMQRRPFAVAGGGLALLVMLGSWTYQRNGTWGDAVTFWSDASAKAPNKPRPALELGVALAREGRDREAMAAVDRAIELGWSRLRSRGKPPAPGVATRQEQQLAKALLNRGALRAKHGETGSAGADIEQALSLHPGYPRALDLRGRLRLETGDLAGAAADFSRAMRKDPDNPELHYRLGIAGHLAGRASQALASYTRAIRLDPGMPGPYVRRAALHIDGGELAAAAKDLEVALSLAPGDTNALARRGYLRTLQGRTEDALEDYERIVAIDGGRPEVYATIGTLRERLGDAAGARAAYSRALELAEPGWHGAPQVRRRLQSLQRDRTP